MEKQKLFLSQGDLILDKFYNGKNEIIHRDGGGCNWNVLYNLSKNLKQKCYAFGTCGNDFDGNFLIDGLNSVNINTNNIFYEDKNTNVMNVIIPSGKLDDNDVNHTWYCPITNELTIHFSNKLPTWVPKELEENEIYVILDKFRKVNMKFIDNIKNKKVCLDVGHVRYIRYFKKEYLLKFFKKANFLLLNDTTSALLYKKFEIKNELELFNILNLDLFVLTSGKNKTIFIINENGKAKVIEKHPVPLANVIDPTGAGDAFFSSLIKEYAYCKIIDENFIDSAFKKASKNACHVLMHLGARLDWDN